MDNYDRGDLVKVTATFVNPDTDTDFDPDAVKLDIIEPDGTFSTKVYGVDDIEKTAVGHYYYLIDADLFGIWEGAFYSTGSGQAREEFEFRVKGGPNTAKEALIAAIPKSRILKVRTRNNNEYNVQGEIRMKAGETLWWGLDMEGTQLSPGKLVRSTLEPTETGSDSDNLTVDDYGPYDTVIGIKLTVAGDATTDDAMGVEVAITPQLGETLIIEAPVTVGE